MNNKLTELVFILDKSGSMSGFEKDTVGGFNTMIEKQKSAPDKVLVTTVFFSNSSVIIHDRLALEEIKPLTEQDYVPCGYTALLDAIGKTVEHINTIHKYAKKEDVPHRTLFVITTDGLENASRGYTTEQIKELIQRQEKERGWEFLFLAANMDAVETARNMGINENRAVNYDVGLDTTAMYEEVGEAVLSCMYIDDADDCFSPLEAKILGRRKLDDDEIDLSKITQKND